MKSYKFRFGEMEIAIVSDGALAYTMDDFFVDVNLEQRDQVLKKYSIEESEIDIPYNCMAVKAEKGWVLIDTGLGAGSYEGVGKLIPNLIEAGIKPEDIEIVILTHAHGDHIGGITDEDGKPNFPNARFVMHHDEWEASTDREMIIAAGREQMLEFLEVKLGAIRENVQLVTEETEIIPGVCVIPAVGHSPGHLIVTIGKKRKKLLFISDLVALPLQVEKPEWFMIFDSTPELAVESRKRIFAQAVEEGTLVFGFHFKMPGLGYIVEEGGNWKWQSLE
jgi:glyoxylase-like metal-dependent hydrolase (beta-lactamase superfamily II)